MSEKSEVLRGNIWVPQYPVELLSKPIPLDKVVTHMPVYKTRAGGYTIPVVYDLSQGERAILSLLAYRALSETELYYLKIFDPNGGISLFPTSIDSGSEKKEPIDGFTVNFFGDVTAECVKAVSPKGNNIELGLEESLGLLPLLRVSVEKAIRRNNEYAASHRNG